MRHDEVGLFEFHTPSSGLATFQSLQAAIDALHREIEDSASREIFKSSYNKWVEGWNQFRGESSGWFERSTMPVVNSLQEYKDRFDAWVDAFEKEGFAAITPKFTVETQVNKAVKKGFLGGVLLVSVVGIGAYYLSRK